MHVIVNPLERDQKAPSITIKCLDDFKDRQPTGAIAAKMHQSLHISHEGTTLYRLFSGYRNVLAYATKRKAV
jgi:hypothetical protein